MQKRMMLVGALFLCLLFPFSTSALAYSQIVAFGDSLSDNGPDDGYGFSATTDPGGLVWVDYLARDLGVDLLDMAYGGARSYGHPASKTGTDATGYQYGFTWQVEEYLTTKTVDQNALYTIWIGGNDLLNLDGDSPQNVIANAAFNIGSAIGDLYMAGATDFVLMNMPNLGATPLMNGQAGLNDMPAVGEALSAGFNTSLAMTQAYLEMLFPNLNLYAIDMFALTYEFMNSTAFDNTTTMFGADLAANIASPDMRYLFWDPIHPTTYAHSLIANAVYGAVAQVPEPSTIVLVGLGIIALAGPGRKKFRK